MHSQILFDSGYQVQKYYKNKGHYTWHSDDKITKHDVRYITFIFYLNTVDDGGETCFCDFKIKPKEGTLLLFPATWTYIHKGNTPVSDNKYILTGWLSIPNIYAI